MGEKGKIKLMYIGFLAGYNFDIVSLKLQLKRMGLFESLGFSCHLHQRLIITY